MKFMCKSTKYKKNLIVTELLSIYQKAEKSTTFLPNEMESIKTKFAGDTLRSAQRDLGLKVELVESWTGDKIKISEDFRETEDIEKK